MSDLKEFDRGNIRVQKYFFTEQSVAANPHFDPALEADQNVMPTMQIFAKEKNHFYYSFTLETEKPEKRPVREHKYEFALAAFIHVAVPEECLDIEYIDGSPMYHSCSHVIYMIVAAMRERIADLTARGPWGSEIIPPMTVSNIIKLTTNAIQVFEQSDAKNADT